jgi:hypothetical protein
MSYLEEVQKKLLNGKTQQEHARETLERAKSPAPAPSLRTWTVSGMRTGEATNRRKS